MVEGKRSGRLEQVQKWYYCIFISRMGDGNGNGEWTSHIQQIKFICTVCPNHMRHSNIFMTNFFLQIPFCR